MLNKLGERINQLAFYGICIIMLIIMFFLSMLSLSGTSDMLMSNFMFEKIEFLKDNIFISISMLVVVALIVYLLYKFSEKLTLKTLQIVLFVFTLIVGFSWLILSMNMPVHDSAIVTSAAYSFSQGDYSDLTGWYFTAFPFQLGYVLINEIIFRITGATYEFVAGFMEVLNVICIAASYYAIIRLVGELFHNEKAQRITAVLFFICPQPILFSVFVYGNILGFAFAVYAIFFIVLYLNKDKKRYAFASAVFIALAVLVKLNYSIVLAAICIIIAINYLRRTKKPFDLLYILAALILTFGLKQAVTLSYEMRSELDIGDGIPMVSWMLMGFNESEIAPGWYSSKYTLGNFDRAESDPKLTSEISIEQLKERLEYFAENKRYALSFFYNKVASQWNEPTYQSIWLNMRNNSNDEMTEIAKYICDSNEYVLKEYMGFLQQLIFFAAFLGILTMIIANKKKQSLLQALFLVIIFGGFVYHLLFEAKSQYLLTYFILMIPIASIGLTSFFEYLDSKLNRLIAKSKAED